MLCVIHSLHDVQVVDMTATGYPIILCFENEETPSMKNIEAEVILYQNSDSPLHQKDITKHDISIKCHMTYLNVVFVNIFIKRLQVS